jgi:high-affinity iron transporter
MKSDIEGHLRASALRAGTGAAVGVFLFTLLMVSREGIETAMLLMQLREAMNLVVGAVIGLAGAASVAWLWSRYGHRVPLGLFFQVSAIFLLVFVVQLFVQGVHEMSEQNFLPYSEFIHESTEAWGPDSPFGHLLTYLLVLAPTTWLVVRGLSQAATPKGVMQHSSAR